MKKLYLSGQIKISLIVHADDNLSLVQLRNSLEDRFAEQIIPFVEQHFNVDNVTIKNFSIVVND